jgi:hypothetical protein
MYEQLGVKYEWREHSSYHTKGEAWTKSTRIMMLTARPAKVVQDIRTKMWWIMIGCNPQAFVVNKRLDSYANN